MAILLLEDKLGITANYLPIWDSMLLRQGMMPAHFRRFSIWKSTVPEAVKAKLLIQKGNRKTPGFNPEVAGVVHGWVKHTVDSIKPEMIVLMDLALLGLIDPNWDTATIDNHRGGIYKIFGIQTLVMTPISAINTMRSVKDVRIMNDGAETKEEFMEDEDHDPEELFVEPYSIKSGRWIFRADLQKLARLYGARDGWQR